MTSTRAAFTLVELLVVVTVIVVLLALLAPALDKAVDAAERSLCASRLHAWGLAHGPYWLENRRRLMSSVRFNPGNPAWPYPNVVWVGSQGKDGQFAVDPIQPYIGGVTEVGYDASARLPIITIGGSWYCPATKLTPEKNTYNTKRRDRTSEDTGGSPDVFVTAAEAQYQTNRVVPPFFVPDYTYYGRIEQWSNLATHPQMLTGKSLEAGRLLMSDSLYRWNSSQAWSFNHSTEGHSIFSPNLGGPNRTGEPPFTGVNQLMGDGSVAWKARERFDPRAMEAGTNDAPHTGTADRNYY
jgi:prepilin-type N-terminal cleavage/methylation domain-containing protein